MSHFLAARRAAFIAQGHRCFYCDAPMWDREPAQFMNRYRVSRREAELLQCTAEHLTARQDGGSNTRQNIVAAHAFCNRHRHRTDAPLCPLMSVYSMTSLMPLSSRFDRNARIRAS